MSTAAKYNVIKNSDCREDSYNYSQESLQDYHTTDTVMKRINISRLIISCKIILLHGQSFLHEVRGLLRPRPFESSAIASAGILLTAWISTEMSTGRSLFSLRPEPPEPAALISAGPGPLNTGGTQFMSIGDARVSTEHVRNIAQGDGDCKRGAGTASPYARSARINGPVSVGTEKKDKRLL